jgi:DNA invertase Pin-like site-specific DNA recombinase
MTCGYAGRDRGIGDNILEVSPVAPVPTEGKAVPRPYFIGYADSSLREPSLDEQMKALNAVSCWNVWCDKGDKKTPQLQLAMMDLRERDVLVVTTLACFRSLERAGETLRDLQARTNPFLSIHDDIDTRTPRGRHFVQLLLWRNELTRTSRREMTLEGLAAARAKGRVGGRPTVLPWYKVAQARDLLERGQYSMSEIAKKLGVARSSLYYAGLARRKK